MNNNNIWFKVADCLQKNESVVLIIVIKKVGSAPVKPGIKMAVSSSGELSGTVGGGVVEFQLVEKAKAMLSEYSQSTIIQRFQHSEKEAEDRSGMICSGSHTVALVPISRDKKAIIKEIASCYQHNSPKRLCISPQAFELKGQCLKESDHKLTETKNGQWEYQENVGCMETLYIIGGGHVGLALSRIMATLGFFLIVIDNRQDLDTMKHNNAADEMKVINYNDISHHVKNGPRSYVVILTFKHQDDCLILRNLIQGDFKYIGMMASRSKRKKIFKNLIDEGVQEEKLEIVHSPIGLSIHSETAEEIAISIAAEIIKVKNAHRWNGATSK